MAIYFSRATWDQITAVLDSVTQAGKGLLWYFPSHSDYSVTLYECDGFEDYEDDEVASIYARLGGVPSAMLCLESRRSKGNVACDAAAALTTQLLGCFEGLADPRGESGGADKLWTLEEMSSGERKDGQRFLDEYRRASHRTTH
jgi:hypothetical protein